MANANNTTKSTPVILCGELHEVAARLAGVEEILLELVESPEGRGNSLHLMAAVVADANKQICLAADRVSKLQKTEATQ